MTAGTGLIQGTGGLTVGGSVAFTKGTDYSTVGSANDVNLGTGALIRLTGAVLKPSPVSPAELTDGS